MCRIIKIENSTAIICGAKKDHVCNEDAVVMEDANGKRYFFDNSTKASDFHENNPDINMCMGSVACSICGDALFDSAYKM